MCFIAVIAIRARSPVTDATAVEIWADGCPDVVAFALFVDTLAFLSGTEVDFFVTHSLLPGREL